jgi:Transposase DNA-binding
MLAPWIVDEMKTASLPDKRLNRRLMQVLDQLASRPTGSIPSACGLSFLRIWYHGWLNSTSTLMDGANYVHMEVNSPGPASGMGSRTV